jgi:hypothetical protein
MPTQSFRPYSVPTLSKDSSGSDPLVAFAGEVELKNRILELQQELTAAKRGLRQAHRLRDEMYAQLGGTGDPLEDEGHPGHMLIQLGWKYSPDDPDDEPDYLGCCWTDPQAPRGRLVMMPVNMALSIALQRLLSRKTRVERLADGDTLDLDED